MKDAEGSTDRKAGGNFESIEVKRGETKRHETRREKEVETFRLKRRAESIYLRIGADANADADAGPEVEVGVQVQVQVEVEVEVEVEVDAGDGVDIAKLSAAVEMGSRDRVAIVSRLKTKFGFSPLFPFPRTATPTASPTPSWLRFAYASSQLCRSLQVPEIATAIGQPGRVSTLHDAGQDLGPWDLGILVSWSLGLLGSWSLGLLGS
ncbi:hypothetical protein MBM_04486 [Drepanopeziza brunnea f. sp. 'multigermtubi' MB_m1]|uniref:Uncharacterized protein n=1 Tax=Marssonina brunnea f. sp. multigermtubi (strain MB_m1) TaxID=1072389 RepID=K1WJ07_MARBU|nr:uncharacterized protein MBM_04486 [Drepanopeziza brunnea f. sp. 'multigermtubi' MB_m1]EKD17625.1 hypothetical protein MBM_04486 [Drepanopeziza brunnea f. sp. 'multigermtubi' MB_m1]